MNPLLFPSITCSLGNDSTQKRNGVSPADDIPNIFAHHVTKPFAGIRPPQVFHDHPCNSQRRLIEFEEAYPIPDFPKRSDIGAGNRQSDHARLQKRQPKTFILTRHEQHICYEIEVADKDAIRNQPRPVPKPVFRQNGNIVPESERIDPAPHPW